MQWAEFCEEWISSVPPGSTFLGQVLRNFGMVVGQLVRDALKEGAPDGPWIPGLVIRSLGAMAYFAGTSTEWLAVLADAARVVASSPAAGEAFVARTDRVRLAVAGAAREGGLGSLPGAGDAAQLRYLLGLVATEELAKSPVALEIWPTVTQSLLGFPDRIGRCPGADRGEQPPGVGPLVGQAHQAAVALMLHCPKATRGHLVWYIHCALSAYAGSDSKIFGNQLLLGMVEVFTEAIPRIVPGGAPGARLWMLEELRKLSNSATTQPVWQAYFTMACYLPPAEVEGFLEMYRPWASEKAAADAFRDHFVPQVPVELRARVLRWMGEHHSKL
mmetsp:Transcript_21385/g.54656  ORF Transcript_21385/g.54656 Transcript_21385/m.54656 type:complete len:331 (+) Transcript_21385:1-993(+)